MTQGSQVMIAPSWWKLIVLPCSIAGVVESAYLMHPTRRRLVNANAHMGGRVHLAIYVIVRAAAQEEQEPAITIKASASAVRAFSVRSARTHGIARITAL